MFSGISSRSLLTMLPLTNSGWCCGRKVVKRLWSSTAFCAKGLENVIATGQEKQAMKTLSSSVTSVWKWFWCPMSARQDCKWQKLLQNECLFRKRILKCCVHSEKRFYSISQPSVAPFFEILSSLKFILFPVTKTKTRNLSMISKCILNLFCRLFSSFFKMRLFHQTLHFFRRIFMFWGSWGFADSKKKKTRKMKQSAWRKEKRRRRFSSFNTPHGKSLISRDVQKPLFIFKKQFDSCMGTLSPLTWMTLLTFEMISNFPRNSRRDLTSFSLTFFLFPFLQILS